jgi:hypothetical protein
MAAKSMDRFRGIATALVVIISASATTHFSVNTLVAWPCTINPGLGGSSAVTCAPAQNATDPARVSYLTNSDGGDMIMTVEF